MGKYERNDNEYDGGFVTRGDIIRLPEYGDDAKAEYEVLWARHDRNTHQPLWIKVKRIDKEDYPKIVRWNSIKSITLVETA